MGEDSKFFIAVAAITGITILGVGLLFTSYWKDHNAKIAEMVASGVDPVAAMCAMQDDYGNHPTCIILATSGGQGKQ